MRNVMTAAAMLCLAGSAQAFTLGGIPQVGLAGYGLVGQIGFSDRIGISSGFTRGKLDVNEFSSGGYNYSGDLNLQNPHVMLNIAPGGGSFRVSAGLYKLNDKFNLTGTRDDIPGAKATANGEYSNQVAPALAIGFESPLQQRGIGYHFSLGAIYAGKPDVTVTVDCGNGIPTTTCNNNSFVRQEKRNIQEKLSQYEFLPILQLGLVFRL